jgi:hypothetical protein
MGRRYNITFKNVSVAALQDLVQVKGAAGKVFKVIKAWWGCTNTTLPTSELLSTEIRFLPATVTDGTSGSAGTVSKIDPGDAAASVTALINSTGLATSGGTVVVLDESGDHLYNGYKSPLDWIDGKNAPVCGPSESICMTFVENPASTVTLSGGITIEEMGG